MNAVRTEKSMSEEERLIRVEADVAHLQKTVEDERSESREFRKKMDDFRFETIDSFGEVRAEIERSRTWIVVSGASLILTILGTAVALARYLKP